MRKRCCKKRKTLPDYSREVLMKGRAETNSKEYLPFPVMLGQILTLLEETPKEEQKDLQFLIPFNEGADADGQYARAVRTGLTARDMSMWTLSRRSWRHFQ